MSAGIVLMALLLWRRCWGFSKLWQTLISISPIVVFISWIVRNLFDAIVRTQMVKYIMPLVRAIKGFNHCFLTLKSCKEPILGGITSGRTLFTSALPLFTLSVIIYGFCPLSTAIHAARLWPSGRWCGPISSSDAMRQQRAMWWWTAVISRCHLCLCQRGLAWSGRNWMHRVSFSKHVPDVPLSMLHLLLHLDDILYNCPFYKVMRSYGSHSETTILWNMECVEKHTSPLMKTFLQMFLPFTPLPSKEPGCV